MALALNGAHALAGNVVALICVEGGVLKDLKTARTFTPDSGVSYGTGTFGEHFATTTAGNSTPKGASFTPAISIDGTTLGISAFFALNTISSSANSSLFPADPTYGGMFLGNTSPTYRIPNVMIGTNGHAGIGAGYEELFGTGTTAVIGNGAHSFCTTRIAGTQTSTSAKLYVDGAYEQQGGSGINAVTTSHTINRINGTPGYSGVAANFVYIVIFDKELTAGETASLHSSLTGNNQFALVTGAAPANAAPTFAGPNIGNLVGTVSTALTSNNVSGKFSDSDALTFSAVGSWPPGVTVSSAGVISGTPTTAGTYASLKVRATDTAAQTVDSDTFSFTISAASSTNAPGATLSVTETITTSGAQSTSSGTATFTTPEGLENNAGTLWLNQAVHWTWTPLGRAGAMSGKTTTDGAGTTHATTGVFTATGLPPGFGELKISIWGATADLDAVYLCYGTAA